MQDSKVGDRRIDLTTMTSPPKLPLSLFNLVTFLLNRAAKIVLEQVEAEMSPFGIRAPHYVVMLLLTQDNMLSQKEIGERLRLDRNMMVRVTDELEQMGMISRRRDPKDRRYYLISVTPEAEDMLLQVGEKVSQADAQVVNQLTQEELDQLRLLLSKLI